MITREIIKKEIDNLCDEYLEIIYRVIQAFERPQRAEETHSNNLSTQSEWEHFVQETYGCLADAPIQRGEQGDFERRAKL